MKVCIEKLIHITGNDFDRLYAMRTKLLLTLVAMGHSKSEKGHAARDQCTKPNFDG